LKRPDGPPRPGIDYKRSEIAKLGLQALGLVFVFGDLIPALPSVLAAREGWPWGLDKYSLLHGNALLRWWDLAWGVAGLLAFAKAGPLVKWLVSKEGEVSLPFAKEKVFEVGLRVLGWWTLIKTALSGIQQMINLFAAGSDLAKPGFLLSPNGLPLVYGWLGLALGLASGLMLVKMPLASLERLGERVRVMLGGDAFEGNAGDKYGL